MDTPDLFTLPDPLPRFDGADYLPKRDDVRLGKQLAKIYELMRDSHWRTLGEIEEATGEPQASISAQLRHLRKKRFGLHIVNRRHEGGGIYKYQLIPR
jgi:hypothetical protein